MSAKRRRGSKKEYARLLRQRADEEARARSESADRQERIKILWQELRKKSDRAKELARDDLGGTLLELVGLQREEINYIRPGHKLCEWAETHAADELAALRKKHLEKHPFMRVLRAVVARATHLTSKQASERRRTQIRRKKVGLIEYEFGGQAEARAFFLGPPLEYNPLQTCLDDILMGYGVDMQYLEALFGLERHRFPNKLPRVRDGRKILYSALAVVRSWTRCSRKNYQNENRERGEDPRKSCGSARPMLEKGCSRESDGGRLLFHGIEKLLIRS